MTFKAELDQRGQEIYGSREIMLDSDAKAYVLIDANAIQLGQEDAWRLTTFPTNLPIEMDGTEGSAREKVTIMDNDRVRLTRSILGKDGVTRETVGSVEYSRSSVSSINGDVIFPGLKDGEEIRGRLKWERDFPVINGIKRWWNKVKTAQRLDSVIN